MPPRHRKEIADTVNPPEPMIPGNRSPRKTCPIAPPNQASARRHLAGLVDHVGPVDRKPTRSHAINLPLDHKPGL
jgi:hypothetical protein